MSKDLSNDLAASFVAAAERASNRFDLERLVSVYASDAVLEVITDGAREVHRGSGPIAAAWKVYVSAMRATGLHLRKELLAADGRTIANSWAGGSTVGIDARGMELWRLDEDGRVVAHHMWQFLDVRPATGLVAQARIGICNPRMGLSLLRARRLTRKEMA